MSRGISFSSKFLNISGHFGTFNNFLAVQRENVAVALLQLSRTRLHVYLSSLHVYVCDRLLRFYHKSTYSLFLHDKNILGKMNLNGANFLLQSISPCLFKRMTFVKQSNLSLFINFRQSETTLHMSYIKAKKQKKNKEKHTANVSVNSINTICEICVITDVFFRAVRENLRIVLSVSSPGSQFQRRCREFPGLTNHISIIFLPHWSRENLVSRASYLLRGKSLSCIFSQYVTLIFTN